MTKKEKEVHDQDSAAQAAADAKAAKEKAAAEAKAVKEAKAAEAKAAKEEAAKKKAEEKAAKEKAVDDTKAAKEAERAEKLKKAEEAKAAKDASKQPEQNGVRRPGPNSQCGKAWSVFDRLSTLQGSPVAIADALEETRKENLNDGNVRTEYARWKKFFGLSGRIAKPSAPEAASASAQA